MASAYPTEASINDVAAPPRPPPYPNYAHNESERERERRVHDEQVRHDRDRQLRREECERYGRNRPA
jgi:hypothetical protein